jgi:hypothetical protein
MYVYLPKPRRINDLERWLTAARSERVSVRIARRVAAPLICVSENC